MANSNNLNAVCMQCLAMDEGAVGLSASRPGRHGSRAVSVGAHTRCLMNFSNGSPFVRITIKSNVYTLSMELLSCMSTTEQTVKISVNDLKADHLFAFNRTLTSILSTTLSERTFAQIIDGLPTCDDVGYFPTYSDEMGENTASSPEAMEAARGLQEHFNSYITVVDAKLAQAYQNAVPRSREFYMRLLEMLAVACHDIAALVFTNTQPGLRREGQSIEQRLAALEGRPTDLMHEEYHYFQQYPKGIADVVGYWAEYHLFGGVVLFDRGESGTDCKRAFLHPVGSFRIFQLSEAQIQQFVEYVQQLVETAREIPPPFPFSAEKYTYRVDPFEAMALNIYRDKYERVIPTERPARCVQRMADFPELQDALVKINRDDSS